MKILIELVGIDRANDLIDYLKSEVPNMNEDYYIRNAIRLI